MASDGQASAPAGTSQAMYDALEREYNLRTRHPEREHVYRGFAERSERWRNRHATHLDLRYAKAERCRIDLFLPDSHAIPGSADDDSRRALLVFIHGGYWRALDKDLFSFIAEPFVEQGICVAMPTYDLAPTVTLSEIVDQMAEAMRWLAAGAQRYGWCNDRVVLSGHSAGGHLAAMMASLNAAQIGGLRIVGVNAISGLFDLEPLRHTNVNHDVGMSIDEALAQSPIHRRNFFANRFLISAGELETRGFIEQGQRFDQHLASLGVASEFQLIDGRTHFDILDDLADPAARLHCATMSMLKR